MCASTKRRASGGTKTKICTRYFIFADYPFDNPILKGGATLPNSFPYSLINIPYQYFITIFSDPYKVIFNLVNRVDPIPIVHLAPRALL